MGPNVREFHQVLSACLEPLGKAKRRSCVVYLQRFEAKPLCRKIIKSVLAPLATGRRAQHIKAKIIEDLGAPFPNADVVVVLKAMLYREAKFDNGEYKYEPTARSVSCRAWV